MKATTSRAVATLWTAAAAAAIGLAGPAHAGPDAQAPVNLPVTDAIRGQLVQAAATLTKHPASDYAGLEPGKSYYAYDPAVDTYWAGAALAGPKTQDAAIMLQDANSYFMFRKAEGDASWIPIRVGYGPNAAMPPEGSCPLPAAIHDLWRLMPGYCHP